MTTLRLNDIKNPFAYGEENIYFMLHRKFFPIQEHRNSTEKNEYDYLYKKDDEITGNENEAIVEYGYDFINCKNFQDYQMDYFVSLWYHQCKYVI